MRALVTGGTGFVGAALVRQLLADGAAVRTLVRDGRDTAVRTDPGAERCEAGLGDPNAIADAAAGCDVVFHCAGESSLHASPRVVAWINVAGTENVLKAARYAGVPRLVHLSCADVTLTGGDRLGWKEDAVLTDIPLGACLRSKLLADDLVRQASTERFRTVTVRPGWLWGPGDRSNLPGLYEEAQSGGVRLFGRGDNIFATTHVDNLVEGLMAAGRSAGAAGKAIHVIDGEFVTAHEFFTLLCRTLGWGAPRRGVYRLSYGLAWLREQVGLPGSWRVDVARRGRASLFDVGRAAHELDYTPRVSMEAGMQALGRWVEDLGGASALRELARSPQTDTDADAHARAADTITSSRG